MKAGLGRNIYGRLVSHASWQCIMLCDIIRLHVILVVVQRNVKPIRASSSLKLFLQLQMISRKPPACPAP